MRLFGLFINSANNGRTDWARYFALAVCCCVWGGASSHAAIVINTDDNGAGSLRAAIEAVNGGGDPVIHFNIPGAAPHVINPATTLPAITNRVTIDGFSQPGAAPNTLSEGDNAVIMVEIRGTLFIGGDGSVVRGLALQGLGLNGNAVTVQGNFIGVDSTGSNPMANATGIYLNSSFEHVIGGVNPAERNIISGSTSSGIGGFGAPNPFNPPTRPTLIQGNYIGTDQSGTAPLPNAASGISLSERYKQIGGTNAGAGNVIAFNGSGGFTFTGRDLETVIFGNSIFSNSGPGIGGGAAGPVITTAAPGSTNVTGIFEGVPGQPYRVEVFSNPGCDPSGYGEGTTFIGAGTGFTDLSGAGSFTVSVAEPLAAGSVVTATMTQDDPEGITSGFSRCVSVGPPVDLSLTVTVPPGTVAARGNMTVSVIIANNSGAPASGIVVTADFPGDLNFVSATGGWTNRGGTVGLALPALGGGAVASSTITVQPQTIGARTLSFHLLADQPDANPENNQARARLVITNSSPRQWMVTNTLSSGPGSLSKAIADANAGVGGDTVVFQIPGAGVHVIDDSFVYAQVPVTIDGYTQPGATPNTLESGDNAVPLIDLGKGAVELTGGSSTVRGLIMSSIFIIGGPGGLGGNNVVEGCFIGTDPTGKQSRTNSGAGVSIQSADDTRIGGTTPAARNVISGNEATAAIKTDSARTIIAGNYIGTDSSGRAPLPNSGAGVWFTGQPQSGGVVASNIIAFNAGPGVAITSPGFGQTARENSIFSNGGIGIDLGSAAPSIKDAPQTNGFNGLLIAPVITNVTAAANLTRAQGYINGAKNTNFRIEFFSSALNTNTFYQSEGESFLGSVNATSDANGRAFFDASFASPAQIVSATATDPVGNTSAFGTYRLNPPKCFSRGDLLIGFSSDGRIQWRSSSGAPISIISNFGRDSISGLAFSPDGTLWAADQITGTLEHFGPCAEPLAPIITDSDVGFPRSTTFDRSGNLYAGLSGTNNNLLKYNPSGQLTKFTVPSSSVGLTYLDLSADQHTLFYETSGSGIKRFDLSTGQPLADFPPKVASPGGIRILPDGGVLTTDGRNLLRFSASGSLVWSNVVLGNGFWQDLRLDPDQASFWAIGVSSFIAHLDLNSGNLLGGFTADISGNAASLAIYGEPVAAAGGSLGPALRVATATGQAIFTWSDSAEGFVLQSTSVLGASAKWENVPGAPAAGNGLLTQKTDLAGAARFYRLVKP